MTIKIFNGAYSAFFIYLKSILKGGITYYG
nr:MAG TPA: hypothetical protein [Caudoviricetes sp.]